MSDISPANPVDEPTEKVADARVFVPLTSLRTRSAEIARADEPPVAEIHEGDLDALAAAATVLGRWAMRAPDVEALAAATAPDMLDMWPLTPDRATRRGLRLLNKWRQAAEDDMQSAADEVTADHLALTVGPGRALASPYESVHRGEEGLLFGPETLAVRAWYSRFQITAPRQGKEPDDHIGLELEFLGTLLAWALEALDEEEHNQSAAFVAAASDFAAEHLIQWAPVWFDLVRENAATDFYRGVGDLGIGLCEGLQLVLPGVKMPPRSTQLL